MNMAEIMNFNASPVTASEKLWKVMRELFYADELAYILNSLQVTSFAQFSSEWISTLSERVKLLNQAGSLWYNKNQPPKNLDFIRDFGGFVANVLH